MGLFVYRYCNQKYISTAKSNQGKGRKCAIKYVLEVFRLLERYAAHMKMARAGYLVERKDIDLCMLGKFGRKLTLQLGLISYIWGEGKVSSGGLVRQSLSTSNESRTYLHEQLVDYKRIAEIKESIISMMFIWLNNPNDRDLENVFYTYNFKKIAVYGYSRLGQILVKKLKNTNIEVDYIIDCNKNLKVPGYRIYHPQDKMPVVDAIIVSNVYDFEKIKRDISKQACSMEIVSLADVLCML